MTGLVFIEKKNYMLHNDSGSFLQKQNQSLELNCIKNKVESYNDMLKLFQQGKDLKQNSVTYSKMYYIKYIKTVNKYITRNLFNS